MMLNYLRLAPYNRLSEAKIGQTIKVKQATFSSTKSRALSDFLSLTLIACLHGRLPADEADKYQTQIRPILKQYCYDCHAGGEKNGNIALDEFVGDVRQSPEIWQKVLQQLRSNSMPPHDEARPSADEKAIAMSWIKSDVFQHDPTRPDPGIVTVRRLNRTEYRNTIRDLMGVEYDTISNFPSDDTGYGFDNIADVLTISPLLLEKYISAAKEIVAKAVPVVSGVAPRRTIPGGEFLKEVLNDGTANPNTIVAPKEENNGNQFGRPSQGPPKDDPLALTMSYKEHSFGKLTTNVTTAGRYKIEVNLKAAEQFVDNIFDYNRCNMSFRIDERVLAEQEFVRQGNEDLSITFDVQLDSGDHNLVFEVIPITPDQPQVRFLRLIVKNVALIGPAGDAYLVPPPNYQRYFPRSVPTSDLERKEYAGELLRSFARQAFRRPVDDETVDRLVSLAESVFTNGKDTFERGIAQSMTAVLASPRFLFREEGVIRDTTRAHPWLDDWSIASRLSYLLWSTTPDQELMLLAAQGVLRENLDKQVDRMLKDPRSSAFFQNFVGQWLQSREVESVSIDSRAVFRRETDARLGMNSSPEADRERRNFLRNKPASELTDSEKVELEKLQNFRQGFGGRNRGPNFDDKVKRAMRNETEMLFQHILKNDLPLTELIDSNYTFLNEDLAKFYEIPMLDPIQGNEMRKVSLPQGSLRGGILTQGTFLAVTSNPNRTSPVKRGLFILENVLGSSVAAPPPDIPSLEDVASKNDGKQPSLRETLAIHRENAVCSSCHNKMDPLGMAFENFNALGRFRDKEFGEAIDVTGTLSSGEAFSNVLDIKKAIVENHKQEIYYCMAEKMLTYALGRGLDFRDNYAIDEIVHRIERSGGKARALLDGVVHSTQFLKRRGVDDTAMIQTSK